MKLLLFKAFFIFILLFVFSINLPLSASANDICPISESENFENESPDENKAPPITIIGKEDSEALNEMIASAISNPDQQINEKSEDEEDDSKTKFIGIIVIIFGLSLFYAIMQKAKKRLKL